jgi:restriction endonuclease Mrr
LRAVLQEFAVDDKDVPYGELANYLSEHHSELFDVHPAKFEELVASVYRDVLGNTVEFCSYGRPDKGIDVVCGRTDSGQLFGIQVKRYKGPIELGQIHQFLGALQLARLNKGVFVTTSRFQHGCYEAIEQSSELLGVEIDLVDGRRFLDFLSLMNPRRDRVYCLGWEKSGYTPNFGPGREIPLAELLRAPIWSKIGTGTSLKWLTPACTDRASRAGDAKGR